jgi:hypothetical protein
MSEQHTQARDDSKSFKAPSPRYSPVFNPDMTDFLAGLIAVANGFGIICGSAVTAEALRTRKTNPQTIFRPSNINVFVLLDAFMVQMGITFRVFDILPTVAKFFRTFRTAINEKGLDYCDDSSSRAVLRLSGIRYDLEKVAVAELKIRVTDPQRAQKAAELPVVQVIFMKERGPSPPRWVIGNTTNKRRKNFGLRVLKGMDLNICRCCLNLEDRTIQFPTDRRIYDYIRTGRFYNSPRLTDSNNRISKFKSRGFFYLGSYDEFNNVLRIKDGSGNNRTVHHDVANPHQYFLPYDAIIN